MHSKMLSEKANKQKVYTQNNKPTTKKKTLNKEASKRTRFPLQALGSLAEEKKSPNRDTEDLGYFG